MNILTCIKKVTDNDTKRKYTEKIKSILLGWVIIKIPV